MVMTIGNFEDLLRARCATNFHPNRFVTWKKLSSFLCSTAQDTRTKNPPGTNTLATSLNVSSMNCCVSLAFAGVQTRQSKQPLSSTMSNLLESNRSPEMRESL